MNKKNKLSTLWIVIMMLLIFADILSIFIELAGEQILDIIGDDIATTMAIAAAITGIPILMIYFSRALPRKINRPLNIVAAILTIIYVIGGGIALPHYILLASVEVVLLLAIIWTAFKWRENTETL